MTKDKAKKYIAGRQFEIMCELELAPKDKWEVRLTTEFAFLKYVNNVLDYIDDECDDIPAPSVFEYKGYVLHQSSYNNHFMIIKDGKMVCHAQYDKKLTEDEAKEKIDFYIDLITAKGQL